MELKSGVTLQGGKYTIVRTLGRGGFGVTYLAEQSGMQRKVCIKEFFPKDYYRRDGDTLRVVLEAESFAPMMERFKDKFLKEARTIALFKHPNIVTIYDVFEENDTAYYVMEYIEGRSLKSLVVANGALGERDAVGYITQVASALEYVHSRNTVHLDVKPDNVMLSDEDGSAVLIDFGLSKHYDEAGSQTSSTPVGISLGYAPLEQYQRSGVSQFQPATDIYSLGATLFTLVTGTVPPEASIVNEEGITHLPQALDSGIKSAIEASMRGRVKERPQTIAEFMALLNGGGKGVVGGGKSVGDGKRDGGGNNGGTTMPLPTEPKKKSKWWLWLLLLLIVAGGAAAWFMSSPKDEPMPTPAEPIVIVADSIAAANDQTAEESSEEQSATPEEVQPVVVEEEEPTPTPDPVLRLTSDSRVTTEYSGSNDTIRYTLENPVSSVNISVSDNANWLTTSVSGSTISYTASANESQSSRTATITVRYGDQSFEVVITQNGKPAPAPDPVLRLISNSRVTTEHSGTNGTIRYTLENPVSGVNISVSDNANWLTTSVSGSTISYTASANESQSSRTATITVRYGDQSFEVVITQNGKPAIYAVGDYYNVNGVEGVVFEISDGGRHGKIVSVDQAFLVWGPRGVNTPADSETNGWANTDAIMRRSDRDSYQAFTWCRDKGPNWYLPAESELLTIYRNKDVINATLRARGYTEISNHWYWSSTEDTEFGAWSVGMRSGYTNVSLKYDGNYVRAVSAF